MSNRLDRRGFLGLLAAAALSGCEIDPSQRTWKVLSLFGALNRRVFTAGPLKQALAKEYPRSAISGSFPVLNLNLAADYADTLKDWKLTVEGLIEKPVSYTLAELQAAFPLYGAVTRHDCVEGWSAIAEWSGVRLADLIAAVKPKAEARYVVMDAADFDNGSTPFYGSLPLELARHPQNVLAYQMNGKPLTVDHGAPLRLRVPTQLGYKSTKFIHRIRFVASLDGLGQGKGGYWEDVGYDYYAGI
ncbi:MAG TPA: molybdopterin-dependent oxidoreductase [Oscillatoriaceae cyanobacterium]